MHFFSFRARHKYVYYLLVAALIFVCFRFVPIVFSCHGAISWKYNKHTIDAHCSDPSFVIRCRRNSRFTRNYGEETICRLKYQSLAKVIDGNRRQTENCQAQMGPMANHEPGKGCVCDYHTLNINNTCQFTDRQCEQIFGTGALALIDEEKGYAHQCRCFDESMPPCKSLQKG